jgi:hypothetical protein
MVQIHGGGHDELLLQGPFAAHEKRLTDAVEQAYRNVREKNGL